MGRVGGEGTGLGGGARRDDAVAVEVAVAWVGGAAVLAGGERTAAAAATAAAAVGLAAMAVSNSGDRVTGLEAFSSGVLGPGAEGRPEWSIVVSGTGESARMPAVLLGLLAIAIS